MRDLQCLDRAKPLYWVFVNPMLRFLVPRAVGLDETQGQPHRAPLRTDWFLQGSFRRGLGTCLLYIVVFEAAIFGSGRLLQIGPVTVKMLLFFLMLIYTAWSFLFLDRTRLCTVLLTISFAALLCLEVVNGLNSAPDMSLIGQDVNPLLAFLALPFFELTIQSKRQLLAVMHVMVFGAVLMAIGYAAVFGMLFLKAVPFEALYGWLHLVGGEDFIFEGETGHFVYKGAIYIGIALIFALFQKGKLSKVIAALLLASFFGIGSRGFFAALALCLFLYVITAQTSIVKKLVFGCIVLAAGVISIPYLFAMAGDKSESNGIRLNTISQVSDRVSPVSAVIGHGFGVGVPERPVHMEIAYLEIAHKEGIVGLIWWSTLFVILAVRFKEALNRGHQDLAYPLFLSAAFVAFESATNPFLNNPIGMYPFMISLVGMGLLAGLDPAGQPSPDWTK